MNNKVIREAGWLVPRFFLQGISLNESGTSGFGDRLRGISLALFLAAYHRTNKIYYHENPSVHFPYRMIDLICIDGLELIPHSPPFPPRTLVVNHRCSYGSSLKSFGFRQLWRLGPKDQAISERIGNLGIGDNHIGVHVRGTDALNKRYRNGVDAQDRLLIDKLSEVRTKHPDKRIYLASDSKIGMEKWHKIATDMGLVVEYNNHAEWDESAHRQSSAAGMLVDFFALSKCHRIVRLVPSEFSRFAAGIKNRRYTGYYVPDII